MSRPIYPEPITRNAASCDADECDSWSREPEAHHYLEVVWGDERLIFCCSNCLLVEMARRTKPTETFG